MEEATKKALAQLNVSLDQVDITVLSEGKSGILGLGAEDARISVRLRKPEKSEETSVPEVAKQVMEEILAKMDIKATVQSERPLQAEEETVEEKPITFNVEGDDLGILIGRRGQTLEALQYLVRLITAKKTNSKAPITVDIENYRRRRYDDLRTLALNVAQQVKAQKRSFKLEPMPAFERRIVHMALANDPDVTTESVGEGESRKVIILLKQRS